MSQSKTFLLNFWSVVRYEIIYLLRDWLFRVFAALSITLLIAFDIIFYTGVFPIAHIFYGLPSFVPYANLVLLNTLQVLFLIFVVADVIKRERELDSNEVLHVREINNVTYLLGKCCGIFFTFIALNFCVTIIAALIHSVSDSVNFIFLPYLFYFIIIPIPTIIFIIGFSLFVVSIVRSQAIAVILLLAFGLISFFYLSAKFFHIFDFFAFQLPLIYSEFSGIPNEWLIGVQRSIYFLLGIAFIFLSIQLFHRLPQSRKATRISYLIMSSGFIGSFFCVYLFLSINFNSQHLRQQMIELNNSYLDVPNISIRSNSINLQHCGNKIKSDAKISIINENDFSLNRIYFFLNPGLKVSKILFNNQKIDFIQNNHIIDVTLDVSIPPFKIDSIHIYYSGYIFDEVCYLDIPEEKRNEDFNIWFYKIAKKYSFLTEDYVLLSAENLWYPVSSHKSSYSNPFTIKKNFVNYKLSVKTKKDLYAISQGEVSSQGDGRFIFKPEKPLTQLSLVIGQYNAKSIRVDSIKYSLYTLENHNYYAEYFSEINDTLGEIIRDVKKEYEQKLGLDYPFKRLNIVEVPIQFYAYPRFWTVATEVVQPEQVWLPENGVSLLYADFSTSRKSLESALRYTPLTMTGEESEITLFRQFVLKTFLGGMRSISKKIRNNLNYLPDYNIFPNYYTYSIYYFSKEWPVFNLMLENFLFDKVNTIRKVTEWYAEGLTPDEKVSQALNQKSLSDLIKSSKDFDLLTEIIKNKSAYFFKQIQSEDGNNDFYNFLVSQINKNRFKSNEMTILANNISNRFQIQLQTLLDFWYKTNQLPGFIFSKIKLYKILNADHFRYQVSFEVSNPEPVPGMVEVSFHYTSKDRPYGRYDNFSESRKLINIEKQQAKKIGIMLDLKPYLIYIDGLLAKNIPLAITKRFIDCKLKKNVEPFDGELDLQKVRVNEDVFNIIVDNEDQGFDKISSSKNNWLKNLIQGDETKEDNFHVTLNYRHPPSGWQRLKNPAFYGEYIHSAYYTGAGKGDVKAIWSANILENGYYSIYTCIFNKSKLLRRWDKEDIFGNFLYYIYHDNDTTKIELNIQQADPSEVWNYLGTFHFSKGLAQVELSNQTDGKVVIADAIKFVKN